MIITLESKFNPGDKVAVHTPYGNIRGKVISEVEYDWLWRHFQYKIIGENFWIYEGELEKDD